MKTFLLLLSLSAVAVGQAPPTAECKGNYCDTALDYCIPGSHVTDMTRVGSGYSFNCQRDKPKPHKRKPPVKPEEVRKQWQAELGGMVCDGISCVGPVEMLPGNRVTQSSDGCNTTTYIDGVAASTTLAYCPSKSLFGQPDKAAVPVEPIKITPEDMQNVEHCFTAGCFNEDVDSVVHYRGTPIPHPPTPLCLYGCIVAAIDEYVEVTAKDGNSVIKLSDSEYSNLQQLRAAVVEEEKRLAVEYGAQQFVHHPYVPPTLCIPEGCPRPIPDTPADHYEFHGQFLLIDKGGK